ncbi:MAG: system Cascade subunit CasD [Desulfovibrionales bacterium]|nr:system Cascade subunit CasD [Desulfovibrionales bacterium]
MRALILRLEAPLMSFGTVAVDEIRPTDTLPGLSMVAGLAANALGLDFGRTGELQQLQDRIRYAARLDREGASLVDYQTALLGNKDMALHTRPFHYVGRKGAATGDTVTVQRYRHYRMDAGVTLALALADGPGPTLDDLENALKLPARPLFLGRLCCPPGEFLYRGERIEAASLREALEKVPRLSRPTSYDAPLFAQWPDEPGEEQGRVLWKTDVRDWLNDVHAGGRYVRQGRIPCPPPGRDNA